MSLFGADAEITFSVTDVLVETLDDVTEVIFLRPYEETLTFSEVKWKNVTLQINVQLQIDILEPRKDIFTNMESSSEISYPFTLLRKDASVQFLFENVTVSSSQQIFLDKEKIANLFGGELFTTKFGCLLKLIDLFRILSLDFSTEFPAISYSSLNSSAVPSEIVLSDIVTLLAYATGSDVYKIVNHIFMADLVPAINGVSTEILAEEGSQTCLKDKSPSGLNGRVTLLGFFSMLMISIFALVYVTYNDWNYRKSHGKQTDVTTKLLTVTDTTNYSSNDIGQYLVESQEIAVGSSESPLPWVVRVGFLVYMLMVSAMMISYLSGVGASVYMDIHLNWDAEKILHFPSLFDFSFLSCLHLFEESRVYLSALLIGLGGLFAPVIIIIMVIFIWMAPPSYMRSRLRISILQTCMTYAKWSIISGYLLDVLGVAFKILVSPPAFEGSYFELFVFGQYAFFANFFSWLGLCAALCFAYYCQLKYSVKFPSVEGEEKEIEKSYSPTKVRERDEQLNFL